MNFADFSINLPPIVCFLTHLFFLIKIISKSFFLLTRKLVSCVKMIFLKKRRKMEKVKTESNGNRWREKMGSEKRNRENVGKIQTARLTS